MKTKTILIAAGVIGGLIGIGVLVNYYLQEDKESDEPKDRDPENRRNKVQVREPVQPIVKPSVHKAEAQLQESPVLPVKEETQAIVNNRSIVLPEEDHHSFEKTNVPSIVSEFVRDSQSSEPLAEEQYPTAIDGETNDEVSDIIMAGPAADEFPLRLGSKGPRVERLQVFLLRNYGVGVKVSGTFDQQTETQVKKRFHTTMLDENTYQRYRMGKHVHEQVFIR